MPGGYADRVTQIRPIETLSYKTKESGRAGFSIFL